MIPRPQAGTETAETLIDTVIDATVDAIVAVTENRDIYDIDVRVPGQIVDVHRAALLSYIAAKEQTITAKDAAISELVERLGKQVARCRTCNGTGGVTEESGAGVYVGLECPDCSDARALVAKHDGAA